MNFLQSVYSKLLLFCLPNKRELVILSICAISLTVFIFPGHQICIAMFSF